MITKQDALEAYKKAIRLKFEKEKKGNHSSFFLSPSRARLRNLCLERMKNNNNSDDLTSFNLFLGFDFCLENANKLKSQTDKFRPIEDFLKGESELSDPEAINMAAILVDFQPRPFRKFAADFNEDAAELEQAEQPGNNTTNVGRIENTERELPLQLPESQTKKDKILNPWSPKRKLTAGIAALLILTMSGYGVKAAFFKEKQCMQWAGDHYEKVACDKPEFAPLYEIKAYDQAKINLKKLKVCDSTPFFKGDKAIVWYSKKNNVVEFFNMDGENPENGCELKKVTQYMIDKYVKPCK